MSDDFSSLTTVQQEQILRQATQSTDNQTSSSFLDGLGSAFDSAVEGVGEFIDSRFRRLAQTGLEPGAEIAAPIPPVEATMAESDDQRVRLRVQNFGYFYHDPSNNLIKPLAATGGIVFPYTPNIMLSHTAAYAAQSPTHSNYAQPFYNSSSTDPITVAGTFTAQNQNEARYLLAVLQFLRSVTKMFRGGNFAGNPPPVLRLGGYGNYIFPDVPVVVTNFTYELPDSVDYITAYPNTSNGTLQTDSSRVPTRTSVAITLQPTYSRRTQREFNMKEFSRGNQLNKGFI